MSDEKRLAVVALLLAALFWSTSGVLIKWVSLHPLAIAGWRSLIAGGAILLLCRKEVRVSWRLNPLLASVCIGAFCICFVMATKLSTAANAIILQTAATAYVAVLAPVMLGEPTRRQDWYVLAAVLVGISLFFFDKLSTQGTIGILVGAVGSLFWAGAMLFLRKSRSGSTAWPLALGNLMAAACCLPFMFRQVPEVRDWVGLIGLGTISLGAGYAVFSYAIKRVSALEAVLIPSVEPLINPTWVYLFTGETPGRWAIVGGGMVLAAIVWRGMAAARPRGRFGMLRSRPLPGV